MQDGFTETATLFGFQYEIVATPEQANIRIWPNSWMHMCKWLDTNGFVSLDPNPRAQGARTADIYICTFTLPWNARADMDYSVMSHEAAHVFGAIEHFGDGLMAQDGGTRASKFIDEEITTMCEKINSFHASVPPSVDEENRPKTPANRLECGAQRPLQ